MRNKTMTQEEAYKIFDDKIPEIVSGEQFLLRDLIEVPQAHVGRYLFEYMEENPKMLKAVDSKPSTYVKI